MTPADFFSLWQRDEPAARAYVASLGEKRLGLATGVAALFGPGDARNAYTYWLRRWDCPPLPLWAQQAGFRWAGDGRALVNEHGRITIASTGQEAIDIALQVVAGLPKAWTRRMLRHGLSAAERAELVQRLDPSAPAPAKTVQLALFQEAA